MRESFLIEAAENRPRWSWSWREIALAGLLLAMLLLVPGLVEGSNSSGTPMPWDSLLTSVKDNLSGRTGAAVAVILVVIGGVVIGTTGWQQGGSKLAQIGIAISVIFGFAFFITAAGGNASLI